MLAPLLLAGMALADPRPVSVMGRATPKVLVYTRTLGWRHDSIPVAIDVLGAKAGEYGVSFDFTEDPGQFVDDNLKKYDTVMFVSTSEEVLDSDGQAALARYFQSGGTYTGVHSASACLYNDTNYLQVVGAYFDFHPTLQQATFLPLNKSHPAIAHLPDRWTFEEEVYNFRSDPRTVGANVLLTVDEASYKHDASSAHDYPPMGDPHPIAWYIESPRSAQPLAEGAPKAGRSFYTSLGHTNDTWRDETFIQHVMNGLTWALDGASTRAYDVGLVGNEERQQVNSTPTSSPTAQPPAGAAGSASVSASSPAGSDKSGAGSWTSGLVSPSAATSPSSSASRTLPALGLLLVISGITSLV